MRLVAWGDAHVDASTAGLQRFADVQGAMRDVAAYACNPENRIDACLFLGDLCNPDSGSVVLRAIHAALEMQLMLERAGVAGIWLAGNHDVIDDGTGRSTITPLRITRATVAECAPSIANVKGVDILLLPYPPRAMRYDPAAYVEKMLIHGAKKCMAAGHLQVNGAQLGSETRDMGRGADVQYPAEQLRERGVNLMLNGHYHCRQEVRGVVMPGSLERLRFDEQGNRCGFLVCEVK